MQRIQKTISEFISDNPVPTVAPDDTVSAAAQAMKSAGSDAVLVQDGAALVGIFTERDFLNRVTAQRRPPAETAVREVMTAEPVTLRAHHNIVYAINLMVVRGFRNIPIVSDTGRAMAVIDVRHVMKHIDEVFAGIGTRTDGADSEWVDIGGG